MIILSCIAHYFIDLPNLHSTFTQPISTNMPVIGKLIKKTTALVYKRSINKGNEYTEQLRMLRTLLEKAEHTNFGKDYQFGSIIHSGDIVLNYRKAVPIFDYESFYKSWLRRTIAGEKDHIWPGRIKYYALSSGTTGSPSKRIPVTHEMIRSFQKTSLKQYTILHELDLPEAFFAASLLAVGGCTKLTRKKTHIEGDLSGILKKHTSLVVTPFAKPGNKIAGIKDWNLKLDQMVEKAPEWNIGIMMGVPSWCIMLLERIVARYRLENIHQLWPNFSVYVHGGVFMQPYIPRLEKVLGHPIHLLDTYLSSEGYFAYQRSVQHSGMTLLLNAGVFYEFIPFNSDYFDEHGNLRDKHTAYTLSEVVENIDYALLISTNSGLWRYLIGDLVRFIDVENREIKITGRIKQFLSLAGEHLSLDNINSALDNVSQKTGISISEFSIIPNHDKLRHEWFLGVTTKTNTVQLAQMLDQELALLNDDYASVRKYTLNTPAVTTVKEQAFYDFLAHIGKSGSQNKFPRVMNAEQAEKWRSFIAQ
jgi:acyl-CoA synthetase (AMP-forming)/AMP-acid ligase II